MPNRVPPLPWKRGRRMPVEAGTSGPGGGERRSTGGGGGIGGAGGDGGAAGEGEPAGGGGGATGRAAPGAPGALGLRKNESRPAGSCPSTIRSDYGRKRPSESTFRASGPPGAAGREALQV